MNQKKKCPYNADTFLYEMLFYHKRVRKRINFIAIIILQKSQNLKFIQWVMAIF